MNQDKMKKQELKKRLEKFSTYEFSTHEYVKAKYIKDGVAVIKLNCNELNDFIDSNSTLQPVLNMEVASYIERIAYDIPAFYPVEIEVIDNGYEDEEKKLINDLIISHFGLKVGDKIYDLNYITVKSILLLLVGLAALTSFFVLSYFDLSALFSDVVTIMGWFAIWEFIDRFWLEREKIQTERMNAGQLATAKIKFIDKN